MNNYRPLFWFGLSSLIARIRLRSDICSQCQKISKMDGQIAKKGGLKNKRKLTIFFHKSPYTEKADPRSKSSFLGPPIFNFRTVYSGRAWTVQGSGNKITKIVWYLDRTILVGNWPRFLIYDSRLNYFNNVTWKVIMKNVMHWFVKIMLWNHVLEMCNFNDL